MVSRRVVDVASVSVGAVDRLFSNEYAAGAGSMNNTYKKETTRNDASGTDRR